MAFTVSNTFAGQTSLSATALDQNFTDIENKLNGSLTTVDLSASAGITTGQLANNVYEFVISCTIQGTALNSTNATSFVLGCVPYHGAAMEYTITGIETCLFLGTGVPSQALIGDILFGNPTDGWGVTVKSAVSTGTASAVTRHTPDHDTIDTNATRPYFFRWDITTGGADFTATESFNISILLEHILRT